MKMEERPVKRTLAAIIVADVVDYSRMMGEDEAGTLRRLTQFRGDFIDPTIARYGGRIVNAVGDSMLLEFDSVVDATQCAIVLQQAIFDRNSSLPEPKRISFRMGVNVGDVIVQSRALYGDGVNVAARLQTLSEPGGICMSSGAYEHIRGRINAPFKDMGAHQVKNIVRDVVAFGLSAQAIGELERPVPPEPRSSRKWFFISAAAVVVIILGAIGANYLLRRTSSLDLASRLEPILTATQGKLNDKARAQLVSDFLSKGQHRAFAIAPRAQSHWWTGDWPSAEIAAEKALERCQLAFNEPCEMVAIDAEMAPRDPSGAYPSHDMPRVNYAGSFNPAQIPGVRPLVITRADVAGYLQAPEPKAAAIHPRGLLTIVTGASSQLRAESQALKLCNDDNSAKDSDEPCYLYAQGEKIVLLQRQTAPMAQ